MQNRAEGLRVSSNQQRIPRLSIRRFIDLLIKELYLSSRVYKPIQGYTAIFASEASDVWAAGFCLFFLLSGRLGYHSSATKLNVARFAVVQNSENYRGYLRGFFVRLFVGFPNFPQVFLVVRRFSVVFVFFPKFSLLLR